MMRPIDRTAACPDWEALTEHRRREGAAAPEGWSRALEHLEGCEGCRHQALRADPTLVFHRLGKAQAEPSAADEVAAMRQAVAGLRQARHLVIAHKEIARQEIAGPSRTAFPVRWRWAAAASVLSASLLAALVVGSGLGGDAFDDGSLADARGGAAGIELAASPGSEALGSLSDLESITELDPSPGLWELDQVVPEAAAGDMDPATAAGPGWGFGWTGLPGVISAQVAASWFQPGFQPDGALAGASPLRAEADGALLDGASFASLGPPPLEDLDRPEASVYHFDSDEMAVVMIVDAGLDV